jgi:hypothetical protein
MGNRAVSNGTVPNKQFENRLLMPIITDAEWIIGRNALGASGAWKRHRADEFRPVPPPPWHPNPAPAKRLLVDDDPGRVNDLLDGYIVRTIEPLW